MPYGLVMTQDAPGNDFLQVLFVLLFTLTVTYAAGRLHQWYRQALERDLAWRDGYDRATHSLYRLAVEAAGGGRTRQAAADAHPQPSPPPAETLPARVVASVVVPITDAPSSLGRHAVRRSGLDDTTQILIADEITRRRLVGRLPPSDRTVEM